MVSTLFSEQPRVESALEGNQRSTFICPKLSRVKELRKFVVHPLGSTETELSCELYTTQNQTSHVQLAYFLVTYAIILSCWVSGSSLVGANNAEKI